MDDSFTFETDIDSLSNINTTELSNFGSDWEEIICDKTKLYRCNFPDCFKTFKYKSELSRHSITHSKEKPYLCTFPGCDKAFKRIDTLEIHLRSHTGTKPFACEHPGCSYRASNKSNLYYHSLKHESTKQYKCSLPGCNKTFLTKAHLEQHEKALFYHKRLANKNEVLCEPVKQAKPNPPAFKEIIIVDVKPNFVENSTKMIDPIGSLLTVSDEKSAEDDFNSILEKLRKENMLLKKALEAKSELHDHLQKLNFETAPQQEYKDPYQFTDNFLFDEQDNIFLDFLKQK